MRWQLERIAGIEERKGNKVWIIYGRIRINEKWWKWDENEEVLKDMKEDRKREVQGEEEEEEEREGK